MRFCNCNHRDAYAHLRICPICGLPKKPDGSKQTFKDPFTGQLFPDDAGPPPALHNGAGEGHGRIITGRVTHDFASSLRFSQDSANEPFWLKVYEQAFPNLHSTVYVRGDGWAQRGGIDRVLTLKSGKTLNVDEKIRKKVYKDILLERWSDMERSGAGWMQKDLACDFIAYAFKPNQTCYLLPFQTLRAAWLKYGRDWIETYTRIHAKNRGYVSEGIAIPINVLMEALQDVMVVKWR